MNGAEYIAEFLSKIGSKKVFVVTGGACAFIIDAIAQNQEVDYYPFQHEQAAAMAADSLWKIDKTIGVTVVTSGPGATNLITGIACSYFDSIPTIHITGQVNQIEKEIYQGASVRQAGFQETNIVDMVKPITKYAVQVTSVEELKIELAKAYEIALSGRMGPVLIDVPMDVQQADAGDSIVINEPKLNLLDADHKDSIQNSIKNFFKDCQRPLVLFGAGVGLADQSEAALNFIESNNLPFVSSWNGMNFFNHKHENYYGNIGVYGNRGANFILQSCDRLLVLGSRLDNRQRGNVKKFAANANVLVIDIDQGELDKHKNNPNHQMIQMDFCNLHEIIDALSVDGDLNPSWGEYRSKIKDKYFTDWPSSSAEKYNSLSPYDVVKKINSLIKEDAVVTVDDGANLCWVFQAFSRTNQTIYTAGGNSPMGYSFPAAIGAALHRKDKQIIAFTGDGSIQMNIQDLQTMKHFDLPIKLFVLNNFGYGIIKQFQDTWFDSRYEATGNGYSQPDFQKIAYAYDLEYRKIESLEDIHQSDLDNSDGIFFDVILHPNTLIEPKIDSGNGLHNMFPYLDLAEDAFEKIFIKEAL
ncbi:thiamine pyrophosphate-binding protein [Gammaproteobacteria bacterium]|jgi:acetolactate synthase I/II/III large subunit|nr:thiamine pyrophosphate-binding protein [Gammaproteobacteria bacterium]